MNKGDMDYLNENMIFVGTIYDSFEALEETLGKLKLEKPLFLTYMAKMAFVEEVFKRADKDVNISKSMPPRLKKCDINNNKIFN